MMDTTYIGFGPLISLRQFSGPLPLSERLSAARQHLGEMFAAGELRVLPEDTQLHLKALELFLLGAADETREGVKRTHGVKLRDFTLGAQVGQRSEDGRFYVIVSGEARTDGLAPTRKRKARA